jgi:hypothetical protein
MEVANDLSRQFVVCRQLFIVSFIVAFHIFHVDNFFAMNNKNISCFFLCHKGDIVDSLEDLDDLKINFHDKFSPQNIDI